MSQFFISCSLGTEADLVSELKSFWFEMMDLDGQPTRCVLQEHQILTGGVELEIPEHLGFQINLFSKLAHRVLLRVHKFEARYFDQLEKEFKKFELEKWLEPQKLILKIETHKSRINNQKSIEESLTPLLKAKKFLVTTGGAEGDAAKEVQALYIRIDKDRVTLSLDTSGPHLHKRGYGVYRGEAPIREVFAAFIFKQLRKNSLSMQDLSVIDPFAGSGTILFEAQSEMFPLFKRNYAWMHFKNRPKLFKSETWMQNYRWLRPENHVAAYAIDIEPKSITNMEENQKIFNDLFPQVKSQINMICDDSLSVDLGPYKALQNAWVITNPPYGHRLHEGSAVQILERFESEIPLQGMVLVHPDAWYFNFTRLKLVSKLDFKNQGLNLKLSVYSV